MARSPHHDKRRREAEALARLDRIREPLLRELEALLENPRYYRGNEPHLCCLRQRNQMRISPLEAKAIARAFRRDPALRAKLPAVLRRLRAELARLEDTTERQGFDCPLLEGTRCLVHQVAKPIGCTAWHPGKDFTKVGWTAFAERDKLNDEVHGPDWKLRVIPLWLERVLAGELRPASTTVPRRAGSGGAPENPCNEGLIGGPSFVASVSDGPVQEMQFGFRSGSGAR